MNTLVLTWARMHGHTHACTHARSRTRQVQAIKQAEAELQQQKDEQEARYISALIAAKQGAGGAGGVAVPHTSAAPPVSHTERALQRGTLPWAS